MKQLEELDPSTIQAIEFNVSSVKKYTSVFTIVLSFAVIILSIVINAESLTEIYKPRKDLEVSSIKFKAVDQKLTDQPLCIVYLPTQSISSTIFMQNEVGSTGSFQIKALPKMASLDGFGPLAAAIGDNAYTCYNLKGFDLRRNDNIKIITDFTANTRILLGTYTIDSILNEQSQQVLELNRAQILVQDTTEIFLSTNLFIIKQRLSINYDPEIIFTFDKRVIKYSTLFIPAVKTEIYLKFNQEYLSLTQNYLGIQYTIVRKNIAEIIGNVLAWRGLILIPISIMLLVFPIVEKYYKFELVKARFDSQIISTTSFGFITDIKIRLSNYFNCFPKQKLINKALQKIEDELDIIAILQLQSIMRRQRMQFNQIQREEDIFDCKIEEKDVKMDLLLENGKKEESQNSRIFLAAQGKQIIFQTNEEKPTSTILETVKSFIYNFDDTETQINISTNQGKGYGSVWSLCSFILLAASVTFVLVYLGVFSLSDSSDSYSAYSVDQQTLKVTIPNHMIALRSYHPMTSVAPRVFIVDQKDNIIEQIALVSDDDCIKIARELNIQTNQWFCLQQDIEIQNIDEKITSIKIIPQFSPPVPSFLLFVGYFEIIVVTQNAEGIRILEKKQNYFSNNANFYQFKPIMKNTNGEKSFNFQVKSIIRKYSPNFSYYVSIGREYILAEFQDGSYWDLFDSAWGIVILVSQLLLFRVGRMINAKILSSKLNTQKQDKRSDILTVLFDIDRLSKGIYKEQLSSVGFYYKHKLPNDSLP